MERTIECIKALSKIEGAVMSLGGITNRAVFNDNIDIVMNYLNEELKKENRIPYVVYDKNMKSEVKICNN